MRRAFGAALVALSLASGCSRTGLWSFGAESDEVPSAGRGGSGGSAGSGAVPAHECTTDVDCETLDRCAPGLCEAGQDGRRVCVVRPLQCFDMRPCTVARCDPDTGTCVSEFPVDADGDGFVGTAPLGAPSTCGGGDCDDADPRVFPGADETCNGKDDDCNGSVDDGATYRPVGEPQPLAPEFARTNRGSITFADTAYALTFRHTAPSTHKEGYFLLVGPDGSRVAPLTLVSDINADSYEGTVSWSGTSFLVAWGDARQAANYEIYATRFDAAGRELSPDQRLTDAPDFSLRPVARFVGSEHALIWDDYRFDDEGGATAIYARRLSTGGVPLGDEVRITAEDEAAEYGALAAGELRLGVAYVVKDVTDAGRIRFRSLDREFGDATPAVELAADGQGPSIVPVNGGFVIAWHTGSQTRLWGPAIQAALVDERGAVLAMRAVTDGDVHAKSAALVSLGGRVVLLWSAFDASGVYALHYLTLSASDLGELSPRRELARSATPGAGFIDPVAVLGPGGDIGVLFEENRGGIPTAYFTRLGCGPTLR